MQTFQLAARVPYTSVVVGAPAEFLHPTSLSHATPDVGIDRVEAFAREHLRPLSQEHGCRSVIFATLLSSAELRRPNEFK